MNANNTSGRPKRGFSIFHDANVFVKMFVHKGSHEPKECTTTYPVLK